MLNTLLYTRKQPSLQQLTTLAAGRVVLYTSSFSCSSSFGRSRLLDKLQSLQNAAARLVTGARKIDRITPVMLELHWLPVRQRIRFKTAVLVFKCLHGLAPEYRSEYCKLTTGRSHLRSANACLLSVPRTRTTYGDRSFAVSGPLAWNSLPVALRSSDVTEETFRRHLKTFLLNCLDK